MENKIDYKAGLRKVSIDEISEFTGLAQPTVRAFLEQGLFPFGVCANASSGKKRVVYVHPILWEKFKKGEIPFISVKSQAGIEARFND